MTAVARMRALGLALLLVSGLAALSLSAAAQAAQKQPRIVNCTISGTNRAETLRGTPGKDVICGEAGDDVVLALGGDDYVFGGRGDDLIRGGPGRDHLHGERGGDRLLGGLGPDFLFGEDGDDRLFGADGVDALYGDFGKDRLAGDGRSLLSGGPGDDVGDQFEGTGYDTCPSSGNTCSFSLHLDVTLWCPSYSVNQGGCIGKTAYGPPDWANPFSDLPAFFAGFSWLDGFGHKNTFYRSMKGIPAGYLNGWVPHAASPNYAIEDAWAATKPGIYWYTPLGAYPGKVGGPFWLTFTNGRIGADMYIDGFLYRK